MPGHTPHPMPGPHSQARPPPPWAVPPSDMNDGEHARPLRWVSVHLCLLAAWPHQTKKALISLSLSLCVSFSSDCLTKKSCQKIKLQLATKIFFRNFVLFMLRMLCKVAWALLLCLCVKSRLGGGDCKQRCCVCALGREYRLFRFGGESGSKTDLFAAI